MVPDSMVRGWSTPGQSWGKVPLPWPLHRRQGCFDTVPVVTLVLKCVTAVLGLRCNGWGKHAHLYVLAS
jgi:hypothetical protein